MKLTPMPRYAPPRYPTEAILRENPAFLHALPNRWRGNRLALGTLAGVLTLMNAACNKQEATSGTHSRVAPLFVHGEGRGSYGCIAVNPPAFLTESEARTVIEEEAKKAGLVFPETKTTRAIAGTNIPLSRLNYEEALKTFKGELMLTGYQPEKRIGYVFVSKDKLHEWHENSGDRYLFSTARYYDLLGVAKALQSSLASQKEDGTLAVFYDPAAKHTGRGPIPPLEISILPKEEREQKWLEWRKEADTPVKAIAEEDLRKQVRDFLAWLKAQGMM